MNDTAALLGWMAALGSYEKVSELERFRHWIERSPSAPERAKKLAHLFAAEEWLNCATEHEVCKCASGVLRYGPLEEVARPSPEGRWALLNTTARELRCETSSFPFDPSPVDLKNCQCLATWLTVKCRDGRPVDWSKCPEGSELVEDSTIDPAERIGEDYCRAGCVRDAGLHPATHPGGAAEFCGFGVAHELLWSCASVVTAAPSEGNARTDPQSIFDKSVQAICESAGKLQEQLEVYLDCDFLDNFMRWINPSQWLAEAFVTYVGGKRNSLYEWQTLNLVRSVHSFSTRPLVVVTFGEFVVPIGWRKFPNLLIYRMRPGIQGISFNYNKLRAMVSARVAVGIELDTDQVVTAGIDTLFEGTQREITRSYPFPILPVHWMSREESEEGVYKDYAFKGWDGIRTMRWGHAHPTWTIWALPFLCDVLLERLLAPSVLMHGDDGSWRIPPESAQTPVPLSMWDFDGVEHKGMSQVLAAGRTIQREIRWTIWMMEDEDHLNVALWRAQATKSWCKFDNFPHLFMSGPQLRDLELYIDSKWFPEGVPLVFISAHGTKDIEFTDWWITLMLRCRDANASALVAHCKPKSQLNEECGRLMQGTMFERWEISGGPRACCCIAPRMEYPIYFKGSWHSRSHFKDPVVRGKGQGHCLIP